jgi:transmembrane sensor
MGRSMAGPKVRVETAEREAAAWHGRLGAKSVSTETLQAFFAWRQAPENAEAYRRVESAWTGGAALRNDADLLQATSAALNRRPDRARRRWIASAVAVGAAVAVVATVGLRLPFGSVYETGIGEERIVQLADGSSLRLDTGTRVTVKFDRGRRLVSLESGQALFTVAHDARRPFVVEAGAAEVTAIGTVFGVRRDAAEVRVVLVEGAVRVVDDKGASERMSAGEQLEVSPARMTRKAADVGVETGWVEGRIQFRDASLPEAVAEVNRYLTRKIELAPGAGRGDTVNGLFKTGDREAFVATASDVFDLRASERADGTILLEPRIK